MFVNARDMPQLAETCLLSGVSHVFPVFCIHLLQWNRIL